LLTAAAALAFVLACACPASAQLDEDGRWANGVTESWWLDRETFSDVEKLNAAILWKSIGEANAQGEGDARAGDYFRGGDTAGTYMRWSPRAGFVIADVNKCEARVRAIIYGRVEVTPTVVNFIPEFYKVPPRKREGEEPPQARTPPEVISYVPVEWRGERLLISEDEMGDFGDYLAGLGDYNGRPAFIYDEFTNFFSRRETRPAQADATESADSVDADGSGADDPGTDDNSGDDDTEESAPYAPPVVPPGYERFLKKPVEATVTAVGRRSLKRDYSLDLTYNSIQYDRASVTRVTLSAGTAQGIKDKMVFRVTEPDEGDTVIVLRAGEHESEAVVVRELDECGAETFYDYGKERERKHSKVAAGWKLTTSPF